MKKRLETKPTLYPLPAVVVGTYDAEGHPDAMTAAWAGICCSEPPCLTVGIRESRLTYENLLRRKALTVHVPSVDLVKETDYFGLVSGRNEDKLAKTGMTCTPGSEVDAPVIDRFPLVLECRLVSTTKLGSHMLVVAEIVAVAAEESVLTPQGELDVRALDPLCYGPAGYYGLGALAGKAFSVGKELLRP